MIPSELNILPLFVDLAELDRCFEPFITESTPFFFANLVCGGDDAIVVVVFVVVVVLL